MGLHDFVKALPITKSVCTRKTTLNILTGVWGNALPHKTLFEAVGKKSVVVCYKTIKKEENLRNKYVLLASSTREKLAEAKEVRDELCNNKKHKIQKRKSKRNI